jgi:Icc-related predicted phosphoesterase
MTRLRLFFATDIHGSEVCFRKFLNAAAAYEADVLIMGGDICGKQIIPVMQRNGSFTADLFGKQIAAEDTGALRELLARIRSEAVYPFVTTPEAWSEIVGNADAEQKLFARLACEMLEGWIALAEERLGKTQVRCLIGAGNDDPCEIDRVLRASEYVEVPDWEILDLGGFPLLTVCEANPTPWHSPREVTEDEYKRRFAEYASKLTDHEKAVYNLHVPPYQSGLDTAPEINARFEVQYAGGEMKVRPVGSTAVRWAIETYQPLLGLHGHVHESPGTVKIGRTTAINPGSDYVQQFLRGALVTLDTRKGLRGYQFTVG